MGITYENTYYNWKDKIYPYFYPADDDWRGEGYFNVEFSLTCYPYKHGSQFDINAFPEELHHMGQNGNTNFYFTAHDNEGNSLTGLSWDEAVEAADALNTRYEDSLDECTENWNWNDLEYEIRLDELVYNK